MLQGSIHMTEVASLAEKPTTHVYSRPVHTETRRLNKISRLIQPQNRKIKHVRVP